MADFNKLVVKSYPKVATRETSDIKFWNKYSVSNIFKSNEVLRYEFSRMLLRNLGLVGINKHEDRVESLCCAIKMSDNVSKKNG